MSKLHRLFERQRVPVTAAAHSALGAVASESLVISSEGNNAAARLAALQERVHAPFNGKDALPRLFATAELLNERLAEYDLVVGDDHGGRLPALLYWRLINMRRSEMGLKPAAMRFMNGALSGRLPNGFIAPPSEPTARGLIVTEFVDGSGDARRLYKAVGRQRDAELLDLAALGTDQQALPLKPESAFFSAVQHDEDTHFDDLEDASFDELRDEPFRFDSATVRAAGTYTDDSFYYETESDFPTFAERDRPFDAAAVVQARQDLSLIASEFYAMLPPVEPR